MQRYSDCPQILRDFLAYHESIKGQSPLTISEYHLDLRMFLRFMKLMRSDMPVNTPLEAIDIRDIDLNFIRGIQVIKPAVPEISPGPPGPARTCSTTLSA